MKVSIDINGKCNFEYISKPELIATINVVINHTKVINYIWEYSKWILEPKKLDSNIDYSKDEISRIMDYFFTIYNSETKFPIEFKFTNPSIHEIHLEIIEHLLKNSLLLKFQLSLSEDITELNLGPFLETENEWENLCDLFPHSRGEGVFIDPCFIKRGKDNIVYMRGFMSFTADFWKKNASEYYENYANYGNCGNYRALCGSLPSKYFPISCVCSANGFQIDVDGKLWVNFRGPINFNQCYYHTK